MSASLMRRLKQARERLQSGDVAGARVICQELLATAPRNPEVLCLLAVTHLMSGHAREALSPLQQALGIEPRHGGALENLGLAHLMLGEFAEAERALQAAAELPRAPASVFMRLGAAMLNQGRAAEAAQQLERALALDGQNPDIHLNLGQAQAQLGQPSSARRHFETALRLDPAYADAMFNLGVLSIGNNELPEAQRWFERALSHRPDHVEALINLGIVHERAQRFDEAIGLFQRALKINPLLAQARSNLAHALALQGKPEAAREQYLAALKLAPGLTAAHEGLALACSTLGYFRESIVHLREVLRTEPANIGALDALANALLETGELNEAETAAKRANALDPAAAGPYGLLADLYVVRGDLDQAVSILESGFERTGAASLLGKLAFQLRRQCDWERWRPAWERLASKLADEAGSVTPFSLLCEPLTAEQQLAHARRWSAAQFGAIAAPHEAAKRAAGHDRVRVGYFSSDFYLHATAYLLAEVLELHDRGRFEIFAFSYGPDDASPMRARLKQACEHFVDIARDPDDIAAQRIRDAGLDILIDLKGYTMGARPAILARRPCPLQVSWLGYPGTMGADFIDYLIADSFIIPPEHEPFYSERVLRLPHCYQPNDRKREIANPHARAYYGLPSNAFVFCCFNQPYKITPEIFACWMRLLQGVPGSVLWLLEDNRWATANLRRAAKAHGIAAERLVFAPKIPLAEHLARYRAADLALDTLPYGSHTTASDALWAECPLVALCGETFAARVSGSILAACGLPELVTHTLDDYERLAYRMATDTSYRDETRTRLAAAKSSAPLFDAPAFTRALEEIYLGLSR